MAERTNTICWHCRNRMSKWWDRHLYTGLCSDCYEKFTRNSSRFYRVSRGFFLVGVVGSGAVMAAGRLLGIEEAEMAQSLPWRLAVFFLGGMLIAGFVLLLIAWFVRVRDIRRQRNLSEAGNQANE